MAEQKKNPQLSGGRGGRGSLILKAMQEAARQPGVAQSSTTTATTSSGSDREYSSGYVSHRALGSTDDSQSSSSESKSSGGRGLALLKAIQEQKSKSSSSSGRGVGGRGNILQALCKEPSKSSDSVGGDTKSLAEDLTRLGISSESEADPVICQGTSGVKFEADSNWIRLAIDPQKAVFEYDVQYKPVIDSKNLRIMLLKSVKASFGDVMSFDGAKLWLPIMLSQEVTVLEAHTKHSGELVEITLTFKHKTVMSQSIQLYNVLFNRVMKVLKHVMIGRSYYSPGSSLMIPHHQLEIWPGYVTSAHHREGGVMLCVDVSHRVLRCVTVYDMMKDIAMSRMHVFKTEAVKVIVGSIVLTRYNNKCYRIDDIIFDSNPKSTFTSSRGEEITYVDYYQNAHNIKIKDQNQPLLLHKVKKKELRDKGDLKIICLIPELCYMTGLTDEMRADFRVMKDLAQHTRLTPTARQGCLRKFIRNVNDNPEAKQVLGDWGLTMVEDSVQLSGRVVAAEPIIFGSHQIEGTQNADWGRESCREKVIRPVDLKSGLWMIVFSSRDEPKAKKFVETLRQVTNFMGIVVGEPKVVRLPNDNTESYVNAIRANYHEQLQMAVVIFPTQREDRYSAVKRLTCSHLGLASQCINARTISQDTKLRSVTQKIALQINCKLGGELWALKIPMTGLMVCGMDVYHDPVNKGNSVVGFVASLNDTLTRWFSQSTFQRPGDEIMSCMKVSFLEALKRYYEITPRSGSLDVAMGLACAKEPVGCAVGDFGPWQGDPRRRGYWEHHSLPRSIIIYRDGVSDGMLKVTKDHEIPQIMSIFHNFDSYDPKFYFVVVQKRINTRIFAMQGGRGADNPPPGSIIDHTITKRYWYDFLLVSQHVRQGTLTPTHYIVLQDAEALKPEHMQRLTYKLTHLYYNWPGTIRVPAPCQYAHKLAYLVGQNVRKEPKQCLQDKLYFL